MNDKRSVRFTVEEMVEFYDPRYSTRLNGMVDCVQTTEGYAEINSDNQVEHLVIDSCVVHAPDKKLTNTEIMRNTDGFVKILNGVLQ